MVSIKGKKKQDGKNYLGPKKDENNFKNLGGSKGPKGYSYVCGNQGHYAHDCKHDKPQNEKKNCSSRW